MSSGGPQDDPVADRDLVTTRTVDPLAAPLGEG